MIRRTERIWKMVREPLPRFFKAAAVQVHNQIDRATSPPSLGPVHELGAGNRQGPLGGMPFVGVMAVGSGAAKLENRWQRNRPQPIGLP